MQEFLLNDKCIITHCGLFIEVAKPDVTKIYPFDIAVGLGRECRWGGHTKKFYSVAEHSVECYKLAAVKYPENILLQFKVLMHDAHEAYIKDLPTPLKKLLPGYDILRERWQTVIEERYNCRCSISDEEIIKEIDVEVLEWEWKYKVNAWNGLELDDKAAADYFLHYFVRLCRHPHVLKP